MSKRSVVLEILLELFFFLLKPLNYGNYGNFGYTTFLVKRANARMRLLHKLVDFGVPQEDLVTIYLLYVRSILEQSCQVWHSSLTLENFQDLERVQKNALKIIFQEEYISYSNALDKAGLTSLFERRTKLCLKFAMASLKHP